MDETNYADLLEALDMNISVVIIAVVKDGILIDWDAAADYYTLQQARSKHEDWPPDANIFLLYGLDAMVLYGDRSFLADKLPDWAVSLPKT